MANKDDDPSGWTRRCAIAAAGLLICGCAATEPRRWNANERWAFGLFAGCQVADGVQTAQARDDPAFAEANPIYGSEPHVDQIIAVKGATTAATYLAAEYMPRHRAAVLASAMALCAAVVAYNASLEDASGRDGGGGGAASR